MNDLHQEILRGKVSGYHRSCRGVNREGHVVNVDESFAVGVFKTRPAIIEIIVDGSANRAEIAARMAAERQFHETAQRLELAIVAGRLGIWERDIGSNVLRWSKRMYDLYGVSEETATPLWEIFEASLHPDDRNNVLETIRNAIMGGGGYDLDFRIVLPDGLVKWIHSAAGVIRDAEGNAVRTVGLNQDISERKYYQLDLEASIREKETLLKEIHHRVKNNLQIISSMLSMQAAALGNLAPAAMLKVSQDRVQAMAAVHAALYKSANFAQIDFKRYVWDLANQLLRSYHLDPDRISLRVDGGNAALPLDSSIPCGLILNELLSNACKHAFPDGRRGTIKIALQQADHTVEIRVEDDGIGLPEKFNWKEGKTLGLELVCLLVEQMRGTIRVLRGKGTRFRITMKRAERKSIYPVDRRRSGAIKQLL